MIMHVVNRARAAQFVSRVIVATDDERIIDAVQEHGGEACMTSKEAQSGTDRIAEVAAQLDSDLIVNVQGDEPLIEPATIDAAIEPLLEYPDLQISTTSEPITSVADLFNSSVVKVVSDRHGFALYFSRSPIPYIRPGGGETLEQFLESAPALLRNYRKHSGLYAFRRDFLQTFTRLSPSRLEGLESLEQLRALENGYRIRVVEVSHRSTGVDTEQDYEQVKRLIEEMNYG
jgi:3-deoxy-manno-octulosonate cytidylyltransferase (CMP-KDO synthetase)